MIQIFRFNALIKKRIRIFIKKEYTVPEWGLILVILGAGIIHGMFISGGPLLIIYAVKKLNTKESFRATLSPVWIVLNSYLMLNQVRQGTLVLSMLTLFVISIPVLLAGVIIGNKLCDTMRQKTFLMLSYVLLLISGVSLLI